MDTVLSPQDRDLKTIPLIDVGADGPLTLLDAVPEHLARIIAHGEDHYGSTALRVGDGLSRRWLKRTRNPYIAEIDAVAARIGGPGAYLLNLSFEWTCTAGVGPDPSGDGNRMLRTLDWPLDGLGENLIVARHETDVGPYYDLTWPGFVGTVTAMAPGRFSAAINQPPMHRYTPSCGLDWLIGRARLWWSRELPPLHLLRRVFETCRGYDDARQVLIQTELAMPAFITLSGLAPDQACVIERSETWGAVREAPASVANHWIAGGSGGRIRGVDSAGRWRMMEAVRDSVGDDFSWMQPPILNPTTRLAAVANAKTGALLAQGWEADGPATTVFRL